MEATELAAVEVGGVRYSGWKTVSLTGSVKEACRSVTLTLAAVLGDEATLALFALFTPLKVYCGADLLFTGYIDRRRARCDLSNAEIEISARSKGSDAVDCSCVHRTGRFERKTPLDIAKELDAFGIGFSTDCPLEPVPQYQLQPGESLFDTVERLCRDQGATLAGQPDGSVKLTKAGATAKRQTGALRQGVNIEIGESNFDGANRHSKVVARGQSFDGHGDGALRLEATAEDSTVPRLRPLIHVQDGDADLARLQRRATNRRDKAAGEGIRASITTPGWRDESGALWAPGAKVWVESSFLGLAQDMLIESVEYQQDEDKSLATLALVDPRAHGGPAGNIGRASGSTDAWAFPS